MVIESQEAIIKRLKFENAALFGVNKSLVKEVTEAEDVIRCLRGDESDDRAASYPGLEADDRCKKAVARAKDVIEDAQFVLNYTPVNPLSLFRRFAERTLEQTKVICDLLGGETTDG